jgi:hypothetical protein
MRNSVLTWCGRLYQKNKKNIISVSNYVNVQVHLRLPPPEIVAKVIGLVLGDGPYTITQSPGMTMVGMPAQVEAINKIINE